MCKSIYVLYDVPSHPLSKIPKTQYFFQQTHLFPPQQAAAVRQVPRTAMELQVSVKPRKVRPAKLRQVMDGKSLGMEGP